MAQVSKFLRKSATGYIHYCGACNEAHHFITEPGWKARWDFDGNVDQPTFAPSMKITWGRFADPDYQPEPGEPDPSGICHYFLKGGHIQYCGDSTHGLSGQTVPLPELPDWMQGERYGDGNP